MFDSKRALADMARQVRLCRGQDGLTLQQLAARSGVAASTIHKVESQQMVPTVTVLLKIAKGLGRRPQELIRDEPTLAHETGSASPSIATVTQASGVQSSDRRLLAPSPNGVGLSNSSPLRKVGVWQIQLSEQKRLPTLDLHPSQRAILLVQKGELNLQAGSRRIHMDAGDCVEVEGERIQSRTAQSGPASLTLIVSPPGNLDRHLGQPTPSAPVFS